MAKFKNKYRIESARLKHFNYGSNAAYYITICTKNRINYLGTIVVDTHNNPYLQSSEIGAIADEYWQQIPQHFPFVILDAFTIMPNHLHGIIIINKTDTQNNIDLQTKQYNTFGAQSQNLASIIRAYKSSVKRYANQHNILFEWQSKYWDRVIRDDIELSNIRDYIYNNPQNWLNDKNYSL
ncbi:MAG: hypothetical protein KF781_04630 [Chitinophagaceae bacterium]|nr:hypothetical protein [Chitinophagaceae bacterium]MCW5904630.1 hypothetical protein [Chitinophagaceae bacterium]